MPVARAAQNLQPGNRIRIMAQVRPAALGGRTGVVTRVHRVNAEVVLDGSRGTPPVLARIAPEALRPSGRPRGHKLAVCLYTSKRDLLVVTVDSDAGLSDVGALVSAALCEHAQTAADDDWYWRLPGRMTHGLRSDRWTAADLTTMSAQAHVAPGDAEWMFPALAAPGGGGLLGIDSDQVTAGQVFVPGDSVEWCNATVALSGFVAASSDVKGVRWYLY